MNLTCIVCPNGCQIEYDLVDGKAVNIKGNKCPRGFAYTQNEVTAPSRMITSTVEISDALYRRLPVITSKPIPKGKIFEVMSEIEKCSVKAPIAINQVIIPKVAGTDVDIIASRSLDKIQ